VLVTGSWTTVKEQMAGLYARKLAERGFAALAFDFRNFGGSDGTARGYESPAMKIADIKAAARHLAGRPELDAARLSALGICASAGYMAQAIVEGAPIRSYAAVAGWFHDAESVPAIYGGADGVAAKIAAGRAARARFAATGEVETIKAFDYTDRTAAMTGPFDYYGLPTRGAVPQWDNRFAVMSWAEWLTYDGVTPATRLAVPALLVHSDKAALPGNVRKIHAAIAGPKRLVWSQDDHLDFYDRPDLVDRAADAVAAHFNSLGR
jgi:fermentation-respiration switch protein FrsA (DUF1100 family)